MTLSLRLVRTAITVVFLFLVVLCVMILFDAADRAPQIHRAAAEKALVQERLLSAPDSETLKQQIRILDYEYRHLFFEQNIEREWGHLFVFPAFILLICLIGTATVLKRFQPPIPNAPLIPRNAPRRLRQTAALAGLLILITAGWFSLPESEEKIESAKPAADPYPTPETFAENWTGFRGAGIVRTRALSNLKLKKIWESPILLPGFSSPIVWKDKVFVTGADRRSRAIFAFDVKTGELLWRQGTEGGERTPSVTDDTGYAAPTPVTDGTRIIACFANGEILCSDMNGNRLWLKSRGIPQILYGYASSPWIAKGRLILQDDTESGQFLRAYDTANGNEVWSTKRESSQSWASPILMEHDSRLILGLVTCTAAEGFDFETGRALWKTDCMAGEVAPSPLYLDGKFLAANDNACAVALNPMTGEELWRNSDALFPDVASPLGIGKNLLLFSNSGVITCLNTEDGTVRWEHEHENGFYSSPLCFGDTILAIDLSGKMILFRVDPEFTLLDSFELGEKTVTIPALSGERLFVRIGNHLHAFEWDKSP